MPLMDDNLSIWKISFRWAGLNPDSLIYRLYIPYAVKDNIRVVLHAIMSNSLFCKSLQPKVLNKHSTPSDQDNLTKVTNARADYKYDRDLLEESTIYRSDFAHWCNRSGVPFPEFWFPAGWVIHELTEGDWLIQENPELKDAFQKNNLPTQPIKQSGKRHDTLEDVWKPLIASAQTIWSQNKTLPIAEVVRMIKLIPELKASAFSESAIRKRIAVYSPIAGKPGRKPNKKTT